MSHVDKARMTKIHSKGLSKELYSYDGIGGFKCHNQCVLVKLSRAAALRYQFDQDSKISSHHGIIPKFPKRMQYSHVRWIICPSGGFQSRGGTPFYHPLFFDFPLTTIHFGDPPYVIIHRNSHINPSWIFEATKSKNNYSTMDSSPDNLVIIKVVATLPPQLLCVYLRSWCYTSLCLFFR